jgi:arylsulfatase A-like enzyme
MYDPFVITADPNAASFQVPGLKLPSDIPLHRLEARKNLLGQFEAHQAIAASYDRFQQRAIDLVTSSSAQRAFALDEEPPALRDRYGRHIHGQSLLLARRLIEAGARLVEVNWHQDHQTFWDTHGNNFRRLKDQLMPPVDQGFSALVEDLAQRGLLEETLLVWVGEFGRSPKITSANAGREHHPWCYSAVLAGGGIRGGQVYGRSDRLGAYPAENPVSPADLTATIYHALGVAPALTVRDREGRPVTLTEGAPVMSLWT